MALMKFTQFQEELMKNPKQIAEEILNESDDKYSMHEFNDNEPGGQMHVRKNHGKQGSGTVGSVIPLEGGEHLAHGVHKRNKRMTPLGVHKTAVDAGKAVVKYHKSEHGGIWKD